MSYEKSIIGVPTQVSCFFLVLGAAPVFSPGSYSGNVDENVPTDTTVSGITLSASESGGGSVTYSIISSAGPFKLSANGTRVLTNGLAVNFEAQNSYTLTVQAESVIMEQCDDVSESVSLTRVSLVLVRGKNDTS